MAKGFFRGRRTRSSDQVRRLVSETQVQANDLIYPFFLVPGKGKRIPVESMPGIERLSVDELVREVDAIREKKIEHILLFGLTDEKDSQGSSAWNEKGPVQEAVRNIKKHHSDLTVMTDVCLCSYTDHGHCGLLGEKGIDNDATLGILSKVALSHAQAGADIVAPSDMMDGRVKAIRHTLDESGFAETPILSYSAKYASAFYGPFRDAADCAPKKGDRKSYQMDPANVRQAMLEMAADLEEGADMLMVKPALAYLDVIRAGKDRFDVPMVAYNVSGEYSMVKAAAAKGWVDEKAMVREILTSIKRAGADKIITYHAKDFAEF